MDAREQAQLPLASQKDRTVSTNEKPGMRVQLISDPETIEALSRAAISDSSVTQPYEIATSDQRLGLVEVAAVVAIVRSSAEVAQLLARAYQALRSKKKITIKSPKGSVTIVGDASIAGADIEKQLSHSHILS
jgi:hypothetical protein